MQVFYDKFSLRIGEQFVNAFMHGMTNSLVVVPFLTTGAIERMCDENNLTRIDHVLLEWWLALTLLNGKIGKVKAVLPVFCGEVKFFKIWNARDEL